MALTANKIRKHKLHERAINVAPVNAGSKIYVGAYICREAATGVVIPGTDAASLVPLGVVVEPLFPSDPDLAIDAAFDNTSGADGTVTATATARAVNYDQAGEYEFTLDGGSDTPKIGQIAYLVDDDTVSTTSTHLVIAGVFTRPGPSGGWFVDIGKRGVWVGLTTGSQSAAIADLSGTVGGVAGDALTAVTDPADTPADADALRDDLVTNTIPTIEANFTDLQAKVNAILAALRAANIIAT
ncbi:MAG TPA: hypothetical protein PKO05_00720 [Thermoanaerobaculia bacterium]|nr:hypothetical protein [Thermoanaerobaculia bacterium]